MAGLIAYDKPVVDFIDALSATGHVTHTQHRKTKVTFHHNGGRLSLQGVLDVWKTRPASAHFQVDGGGALGQYVKVNEYAWATGTTAGNRDSVSIELANASLAPHWLVSETTMMEGARLAGWIFARVIGAPPTRDNLKVHHDWKSTLCAGPCIDANYDRMLKQAQIAYLYFTGYKPAPIPDPGSASPAPAGAGTPSLLPLDQIARQVIVGSWGNGDDRVRRLRGAGYDPVAVQDEVDRQLKAGPAPAPKTVDQIAREVLRGDWGNNPERSRRLQAAGYNPTEVQEAVNGLSGRRAPIVRPSLRVVAQQVVEGQWASGQERRRRLIAAGYDADAVQAEVNRLLS